MSSPERGHSDDHFDDDQLDELRAKADALGVPGAAGLGREELKAALRSQKPSQGQVSETPQQQGAERTEDT